SEINRNLSIFDIFLMKPPQSHDMGWAIVGFQYQADFFSRQCGGYFHNEAILTASLARVHGCWWPCHSVSLVCDGSADRRRT
ncbi:MAG: hypothetical protein ACI912_001244, partial [Marinobacter psychrophilus]